MASWWFAPGTALASTIKTDCYNITEILLKLTLKWVSDCCVMPTQQFFCYIKLIFNEMMMGSALFYTNTLSWIVKVLAHWNNSLQVDKLLHSNTLFWFRATKPSLLLLNAACLAEKRNKYQFYSLWFYPPRDWTHNVPHSTSSRGKDADHCTTDAVESGV